MNAVERAAELMHIPFSEMPMYAFMFGQFLSHKYGMCGEVLLTAYAGYAQDVEKLSCDDDLYRTNEKDWTEFTNWLKTVKLFPDKE